MSVFFIELYRIVLYCVRNVLWLKTVRPRAKVMTAYKSYKEINWYQNKWPWPLFRGRIKVMSICQPLRYIRRWIFRNETVRDRGLVPKDNQ